MGGGVDLYADRLICKYGTHGTSECLQIEQYLLVKIIVDCK